MKKRVHIRRITAMLLSAAIVFSVSSAQALASPAEVQEEITGYSIEELPQNTQALLSETENVLSIEKDDDPYSITVDHEDGSKTTTVYAVPVKYTGEDGKTEFVDTSMVSTGLLANVFQGYQYKNKANAFTAEFSKNADKGIRFSVDGSQLEMKPMRETAAAKVESSLAFSAAERSAAKKAEAAVKASVEKASDSNSEDAFVYENVFGADTAVKYYNTNTGVKEDIILYKPVGMNRFAFEIDTGGDTPVLNPESGKIDVYDKDNPDEVKYRFGNLYAYDSYIPPQEPESTESEELEELSPEVRAGQFSDEIDEPEPPFHHNNLDCTYELEELGDSKYIITAVVPEEWLNHPDVVYPVTINPPINAVSSATNIDDTYARESSPNSNHYLSDRLRFGNMDGGRVYTYLRFITMPSLSNQAITKATLKLTLLNGVTSAHPVYAFRVSKAWEGKSLTWNNSPTYAEKTQDSYGHNSLTGYQIDISSIVGRWYNGYANYGVLVNYADYKINDYNGVYSSDCGDATIMPQLEIKYEPLEAISNGVYYIRNQNSGKYIDVESKATTNSANIHQWQFHGGTVQQWEITAVSGRWYSIRPQHAPSMAMDVGAHSPFNDANIMQYTYNGGTNQQFGFVKNANGSYRIVTRTTGGARELSVNSRSTANGANIAQHTYNNKYTNDHWWLERSDQVAELTVYSLPSGGHAWITIKNNLGTNINVDVLSVLPGQEISVGTFGNQKGHLGVWFNVECYHANSNDYKGRVSLSQYININQLNTINNYIKNNDTWSLHNNCSNFAAGVWNSVSSNSLKFSAWPTPSALASEIKKKSGYKTDRVFQQAASKDIGYKDASSNSFYSAGSSSLSGSLSS